MKYLRKILTMSPDESIETLPYLCTAEYAGHMEAVCLGKDGELLVFPPMATVGPNAMYIKSVRDASDLELDELEYRLECRSKTAIHCEIAEMFGDPNEAVETNLTRVRNMFGQTNNFIQQCDRASVPSQLWKDLFPDGVETVHDEIMLDCDFTPEELADYEEMLGTPRGLLGSNDVFADIYGGCDYPCCKTSLIGSLVVLQPALEYEENGGGEYIVLFESEDSIYGVNTFNVLSGGLVERFPIGIGEDYQYEIIESYKDDEFILQFIERLQNYVAGGFDDCDGCPDHLQKDATITVIRQLERLMGKKAESGAFLYELG